ncbi:DUF4870 domain-containing protein [Bacillus alkalisoli]|uniref:DUF4870 domain-containing protein n=1 Tax=Bacillus alkalisoli TaxID=2011008 RepID=UPI000C250BEB|nr:DUF4870 domain-containing protein [Bacillus alkalisoli]
MCNNDKVIASLCYFSVFFAPFLLPIVVYFIVDNREVKSHALASLWSHILPMLVIPIFILGAIVFDAILIIIISFIISGLVTIIVIVWNVVKGIQLLRQS